MMEENFLISNYRVGKEFYFSVEEIEEMINNQVQF